jgi:hypothetical protein
MPYVGRSTDKISNVEVLDNITFDGSSSYTLQKNSVNFTPSSANTLLVSIDGVVQAGNFTVSGSTIDFGTAVAGTSTCDFILHYGIGLITTVSDGTVTTAKLADSSVTTAKLADSSVTTAKLNDASVSLVKLTATGTKDATTFLRGDNSFQEVPAGGITEADQWRLTASFTGSGDLTSNLERIDTNSPGLIGTGMSESSGIFTFPSTGVYLITAVFASYLNGSNRAHNGGIHVTTDNSSYTGASSNYTNQFNFGNTVYANSKTELLFDVTSTTTHKVKFHISTDNASSTTYGGTTENGTCFSFIRLGDT